MLDDLTHRAEEVFRSLQRNERLAPFLDTSLAIPAPFVGNGEIRLVVVGQDPTVRDPRRRRLIKTALNLDRRGSLLAYLGTVCKGLRVDLREHLYATNLLKNFFVMPPTEINQVPIFELAASEWLPLLRDELAPFSSAPVITLGEPLLRVIAGDDLARVRAYWGYVPGWQRSRHRPAFRYLGPSDNRLERLVFPFPHQPSLRKAYYKKHLPAYIRFVRRTSFAAA